MTSLTWSELRKEIGVGKFYEKVLFRKLKGKRTDEFITKFDEFL